MTYSNQSASPAATTSAATIQLSIARHALRQHGERQRIIWLRKMGRAYPAQPGDFMQD